MARPLRIEYAGALYHLTARGNARGDIYRDDGDRRQFLTLLQHTCERFDWYCYAYCLMTNHYHLLIETHTEYRVRSLILKFGIKNQRPDPIILFLKYRENKPGTPGSKGRYRLYGLAN